MKKFRKKPVVIEAEQWLQTVEQQERLLAEGVIMISAARDGSCLVPTLYGNLTCRLNDYIVKDENGQYGVCEAELFEATFDLEYETLEVVVNAETLGLNPEFVGAGIEVGDVITVDAKDSEDTITLDSIRAKKADKEAKSKE